MLPVSKRHEGRRQRLHDYRSVQLVLQLEPAIGLEDRDVGAVVTLDSPSAIYLVT